MNLKKYDNNRDVYIPPDQDVWYILEFKKTSGTVIMTYFNQNLALSQQKPIHKVIKVTRDGSVAHGVLSKKYLTTTK